MPCLIGLRRYRYIGFRVQSRCLPTTGSEKHIIILILLQLLLELQILDLKDGRFSICWGGMRIIVN